MSRVALVLAAGLSRRFGPENKLMAPFRGRPLAAHAAAAVAAVPFAHRLAVCASPQVAQLFAGFAHVAPPAGAGPAQSASLAAGLAQARALGAESLTIVLADMPFVTADLIAEVAALGGRLGAACAHDGTRRSPPACFSLRHFEALAALSGDAGAGRLLADLPPTALVAAAPGALADIDTPEMLARHDTEPR